MEKREIDSHKLIYHPERVAEWIIKKDCFPIYVESGLTNRCNHRCVFCALDWVEHGTADINSGIFVRSLEDMAKNGVKSIMFAGEGEPLLHKDAGLFARKAKEYGLDVSITTNGVNFDYQKAEEILPNLSWIRFSVDAGTSETYSKIHRTRKSDFEDVKINIYNASQLKQKLKLEAVIGAQFLLLPENADEAVQFAELMHNLGADNVQIKPYSQHPDSKNKIKVDYKDYKKLEKKLEKINSEHFRVFFRTETMQRIKERFPYDACYGLPFFALTDARGNVIPCTLFYNNPEFTYGNLYQNSFSEIWKGEKRKQVLKTMSELGISQCREVCRLDAINRYLHRIKHPQAHDNFI